MSKLLTTEERLGINAISIVLSEETNSKKFYFVFENYLPALKYKMMDKVSLVQGIEGRYSVVYREHKVSYFFCEKTDTIMIIDCYKLSTKEHILNMMKISLVY